MELTQANLQKHKDMLDKTIGMTDALSAAAREAMVECCQQSTMAETREDEIKFLEARDLFAGLAGALTEATGKLLKARGLGGRVDLPNAPRGGGT